MPLPNGWQPRASMLRGATLWTLVLILAVAALVLAGCGQGARGAATTGFALTLVHSNDTQGKLEPCG